MKWSSLILLYSLILAFGFISWELYTKNDQVKQLLENRICRLEDTTYVCQLDELTEETFEQLGELFTWYSYIDLFQLWISFWIIVWIIDHL